ncbi:MAG: hypothetical protein H6883_07120 [Rhodobiaceae bacterium]|nr:hypothetical protein [Rhodobiaceae bacterium]MCC0055891.1 hypothetical protein [Rhodobiaceae bacterium]
MSPLSQLSPDSPRCRLGHFLRFVVNTHRNEAGIVAVRAGVPRRHVLLAMDGRAIPVKSYLPLCASLGVDPATGLPGDTHRAFEYGEAILAARLADALSSAPSVSRRAASAVVDGGGPSAPASAAASRRRAGGPIVSGNACSIRSVARESGVPIATLSRAVNGKAISVDNFLALCRWLKAAPLSFGVKSRATLAGLSARKWASLPRGQSSLRSDVAGAHGSPSSTGKARLHDGANNVSREKQWNTFAGSPSRRREATVEDGAENRGAA